MVCVLVTKKDVCVCIYEQPLLFPGHCSVLLPRRASHSQFVALLIDRDTIQLTEVQPGLFKSQQIELGLHPFIVGICAQSSCF
jgi:hypothetical protein